MAYGWPPRNEREIHKWKATAQLKNSNFLWPENVNKMAGKTKISILVKQNPKVHDARPWHRYNLYIDGMSVEEYIDAVIKKRERLVKEKTEAHARIVAIADLAWDHNHAYISFY
jgi:hypothetical protein